MPNRFIKECCRTSPTLQTLTHFQERLFWRLLTVADDFGRFEAQPLFIKNTCFPLGCDETLADVSRCLQMFADQNMCVFYTKNGRSYGQFLNFTRYQGPPRAKVSKFPDPPKQQENHMLANDSICKQMHDSSVFVSVSESVSDKEKITKKESELSKKKKDTKPTPWPADFTFTEDLRLKAEAYWKSKGKILDPSHIWTQFEAHHKAKGSKFVSWPDAWKTWYVNAVDFSKNGHGPAPSGLCVFRVYREQDRRYSECGAPPVGLWKKKPFCLKHMAEVEQVAP